MVVLLDPILCQEVDCLGHVHLGTSVSHGVDAYACVEPPWGGTPRPPPSAQIHILVKPPRKSAPFSEGWNAGGGGLLVGLQLGYVHPVAPVPRRAVREPDHHHRQLRQQALSHPSLLEPSLQAPMPLRGGSAKSAMARRGLSCALQRRSREDRLSRCGPACGVEWGRKLEARAYPIKRRFSCLAESNASVNGTHRVVMTCCSCVSRSARKLLV